MPLWPVLTVAYRPTNAPGTYRRIIAVSTVKRTLYRSVVVKRELRRRARLSIYQSVCVPTVTCGQITATIRSWIQVTEMSFLCRFLGFSLRGKGVLGSSARTAVLTTWTQVSGRKWIVFLFILFHCKDLTSTVVKMGSLHKNKPFLAVSFFSQFDPVFG